jgi:hypothetical protein
MSDFAATAGLLETGELSGNDMVDGLDIAVVDNSDLAGFDFSLDPVAPVGAQSQTTPIMVSSSEPRSVRTLRSYSSSGRRSRSRPHLVVNTHLADVIEISSSEGRASSASSSSSDASVHFADQRGFVHSLSARRSDFLDDEDSEDGHGIPRSATPLESSVSGPSNSSLASPRVEVAYELFADAVWHYGPPVLELTFPLTPTETYPPAANAFSDSEILQAIETELLGLMHYMFQCINTGRSTELQVLGSDLQWALSAIADVFPSFGMFQHLGSAVEILLEIIVTSGSI